mgnify:CR=1 FL=1
MPKTFIDTLKNIDSDRRVDCDETGVNTTLSPKYGESKKGTRSYGQRRGFPTERISLVAFAGKKRLSHLLNTQEQKFVYSMGENAVLPSLETRLNCRNGQRFFS